MEAKYHIVMYLGIGVTIQQKALNKSEQEDEDTIFREWNHSIRGMCQKSVTEASYMAMLYIQIVREEQVLLCYVYPIFGI